MQKVDWKTKLTSRKFWAALVGFVSALLIGFGFAETEITQVTSIIMAGATLIAYIFGEGLVDASRNNAGSNMSNTAESEGKNE